MSFALIPTEIRCVIFAFLTPRDLCVATLVCREWHDTLLETDVDTSGGGFLWKNAFQSHFGGPRTPNQTWKQATVQCVTHLKKSTSDEHTFRWSVAGGHVIVLAQLLNKHPEWRGTRLDSFPSDAQGTNTRPLHLAASGGHANVAYLLAFHGANPTILNFKQETPMQIACAKGHLDVMEILLTFAMEGIQELRDAPDMLLRAAAGGFTALTDKMADLNGGKVDVVDKRGQTPLFKACARNSLPTARLLVDKYHADVNIADREELTPIFYATSHNNLEMVNYLLAAGATVSNKLAGHSKTTPLHLACKLGNADLARVLIDHGAKLSVQTPRKKTVLHEAIEHGNLEMVRFLLSLPDVTKLFRLCDDIGMLPLNATIFSVVCAVHTAEASMIFAHKAKHTSKVKEEMKQDQEKEKETENVGQERKDEDSFKGKNLLEEVPFEGEIKNRFMIVEMLLNAGANPSRNLHDDACVYPPLHSCLPLAPPSPDDDLYPIPNAGYIQEMLIELLVKHGASINETFRGKGMVTLAARTGLLRLVKKCVEMGADPLHVSYYADQTPLCGLDAITKARQEIVLYLLEKGVSINTGAPLHSTTEPIYAKFLVDHGADPFVLQASRSVIHQMIEMSAMPMKIEQCKELVEYYLSLGLDVNAVDNQGLTPLHIIADSPYARRAHTFGKTQVEMAKLLLSHGADPTLESKSGSTAESLARGYLLIGPYLEQAASEWRSQHE